jgi:glycerate kinase
VREGCHDAAVPSVPVPERPVLVAPAAFPGRFRAAEVAGRIGRGLERAGLMPPDLCPVADGGAGTLEALLPALGGELVGVEVEGADGRPVRAHVALLEDGTTALVEVVPPSGDPGAARAGASARVAGELICAAAATGAAVVVVAAGGAAWGDDGERAVQAIAGHGGLGGARLVVLTGTRGASGGLAGALAAAHRAVLEPGGPWILAALDFDARMRASRAVVTGEGTLDERTLRGGVVGEIGTRARQGGVPLHAVVGRDALDAFGKRIIDLQVVQEATTAEELEAAGERLGLALATGQA